MKKSINTFKRYEKKYIIDSNQYDKLMMLFKNQMQFDEYSESQINNIYYDTHDFKMIRASIEKPVYKEKIRLRSYGTPEAYDDVFLEIKKKHDGIVYKRRLQMPYSTAKVCMMKNKCMDNTQIGKEIQWSLDYYRPEPKVFIGYHRLAMKGIEDENLRITLDNNLLFRDYDLSLSSGSYGQYLLEKGQYIMEIKTIGGMPLWLSKALDELRVMPSSFSKYGVAYKTMLRRFLLEEGVVNHD